MDFLQKILPFIGAAASGNVPALVAMAANAVGEAIGGKVDPSVKAIVAAVQGANPEQLLALKQSEQDFAAKMQAMGFQNVQELERIAAADRSGAREREIKTGDSWTPRILAGLVVVGWLAVQAFLLTHIVDGSMRELVARVLGTLDGALMLVLSYYFGSSAGSAHKNELMARKTGE